MDIGDWLRELGLERYEQAFRDNEIDLRVLPELTAQDLKELGVTAIGHRRLLLKAITDRAGKAPVAPPIFAAAEAERRQLTVMFCDLVGSTPLAVRFDPEDLRDILGAYHRCVADTVTRFGGFVAKYMGDGVLVYFGYPQAHEEDPERAARAGLALIEAVGQLDLAERLQVRIGIASGLVVVGDLIGVGAAQEHSVVGETPNLAARLQALAAPGSVVIAEATQRLVGGLFELVDLGAQSLAGFAEPQAAWRVVAISDVASRFDALRSRETPLVGRDEELELLLYRWRQASKGEGGVVLISAEPGMGKSRLSEELRQRASAERHLQLCYFCSPLHKDSALYPVIGQLEHAAGFARDDDATARCGKLTAMLGSPAGDDVALLADLLSIGDPNATAAYTPQQKKARTLDVLLRNLDALAARHQVLLVFEDLHWVDPTTLELLDLIIARVEQLPVLLVATFRPEFKAGWVGQPHVTMLSLSRLGRSDGAGLVRKLAAKTVTLHDDVIDDILDRSDGVPLFLEEVTKVVLETAPGAPDTIATIPRARAAVPATLQASLLARLDRLGSAAREIAQTGAAIGREFPYELLMAVSSRGDTETRAAVDQLVGSGLVFQHGVPPVAEYQFKHALVQDTAYGTLLRGSRQALHARVATAIERNYPHRVEREPELLAYHLAEAGKPERAVTFWRAAGELAVQRGANREAVGHFRRALALIERRADDIERRRDELTILSQLAPPMMAVYGWSAPEVGDVVERAAEIGRRLPSSTEIAPAIANLWIFNTGRGRLDRAEEISKDLFRIAQELGDADILLQAHHCAWATHFNCGRLRASAEAIAAGATLYDIERHAHHRNVYLGHDPRTCGMNFDACTQFALGYPERARQLAADGVALARRLKHPPSLANSLWRACEAFIHLNDIKALIATADDLIGLTDDHDLPMPRAYALNFLGWGMVKEGDVAAGLVRIEETEQRLASIGAVLQTTFRWGLRAEALLAGNRYDDALTLLDQALATAEKLGERVYMSRLYRARAAALRHLRGVEEKQVEATLQQAIDVSRQQHAKGWEIGAATDLARLWLERGHHAEARDLLAPVYDWFTEGFDTAALKDAKALLDALA